MLGAIIGDIIGSRFQYNPLDEKHPELLHKSCAFTDNTTSVYGILKGTSFLIDHNIVVSEIINANAVEANNEVSVNFKKIAFKIFAKNLREVCNKYPHLDYGKKFNEWLKDNHYGAYNSKANGALMRVVAVPFVTKTLEHALFYSRHATRITHNHPESLETVEKYIKIIYIVKKWNNDIESLKKMLVGLSAKFELDVKTVDEYKKIGGNHIFAKDTLERVIACVLEAKSYEDTIKNVLNIGSDVSSTATIAGSIAEYMYGVPPDFIVKSIKYYDHKSIEILHGITQEYLNNVEVGDLAQNHIYSDKHKELYLKIKKIKIANPTAAFDPLEELSNKEYYTKADIVLRNKKKVNLFSYLKDMVGKFTD